MLSSGPTVRQLSTPFVDGSSPSSFRGGAPALPGIPQNVAGTAGDTAVLLSWNAAANATAYDYRLDQNDATITQLGNVSSQNIPGLTNDQSYAFQVRGRNGSNVSAWSTAINRTPVEAAGSATTATAKALSWAALNGTNFDPGRVNFYVDYSERTNVGDHGFLVARTHGTKGAVSVSYISEGDSHTTVSGTLSWADGEADIKLVVVSAPSKGAGDHRMRLRLHTPTGGLVLHFGASHTVAYGTIDDGTIAPDSEAVFFNTAASSNGDGSQNSPFDNIYDAITNAGSKRYIYGQGTVTPDGTYQSGPYSQTTNCLPVPASRAGEDSRVYIRNWPGQTLTIDGNGSTSTAGFVSNGSHSYHTYRGINFTNLNTTSGQGIPGWGIWYHYGSWNGLGVELCTFDGINGSENNGGVNPYGGSGTKVWRCTFANIQLNGDDTGGNTAGVFSYEGDSVSVQRCEFESSMASACFHKRTIQGKVSFGLRFNILRGCNIHYGVITHGHFGIICSNNLLIGSESRIKHKTIVDQNIYSDNLISNNYFYQSGKNEEGAITAQRMGGAIVFGNIFDNCRRIYYDGDGVSDPLFLDYNVEYQTQFDLYGINVYYATSAALNAAFPAYAANDVSGNPLPTNLVGEDVSLAVGSSGLGASLGGSDAGVYLIGNEKIGAAA